ncbi:MAG: FAD-dependent oxidoreductase, partial [Chloroflexota bacterium]|nr:FAD-dependent oxidoreductase [Chloroflexota bacterium]
MTAALELSKHGQQVSLFEAAPALGGQAGTFAVEGARLERFYHHLFMSDLDMIDLVEQLELRSRLLWVRPKMGLYHQGQVHEFGTASSLLRLPYLSLWDKFRFGLVTLFLMRFNRYELFERSTAWDWLSRAVGRRAFAVVWGPMLEAKFSRYSRQASMVWFWGKVAVRGASRQSGQERLGYFNLSFQVLIDALEQRLTSQGVEIRTSCPVRELRPQPDGQLQLQLDGQARSYDKVVMALHNRDFLRMTPSLPDEYVRQLRRIEYEGASCLLLSLERSLSPIYWMNISAPDMPFTAVIEHTNFMPPERYNGKHVVYLSRYLAADDPMFGFSQDEFL